MNTSLISTKSVGWGLDERPGLETLISRHDLPMNSAPNPSTNYSHPIESKKQIESRTKMLINGYRYKLVAT